MWNLATSNSCGPFEKLNLLEFIDRETWQIFHVLYNIGIAIFELVQDTTVWYLLRSDVSTIFWYYLEMILLSVFLRVSSHR